MAMASAYHQLRPPPSGPVFGVHADAAGRTTIPNSHRLPTPPRLRVIDVWPYDADGEDAFYAALEFWAALHGFAAGNDRCDAFGCHGAGSTPTPSSDMVLRLATGMAHRSDADLR